MAMKTKRKPTDCATKITDLPKHIFHTVLLKLSTKRILVCKFVCKAWRDLISDPEFSNLHFAQAEPFPLVRPTDRGRVSRTLYMVEPEHSSEFDLNHCACAYKRPCDRSHVHMNLTKYKIPVRNAEEVIQKLVNASSVACDNSIRLRKCYKYETVNSCNGLLCLAEPLFSDPAVVCNPITGEFINLPVGSGHDGRYRVSGGFGFSPKTNEYKVVRLFNQRVHPTYVAEIHTLGTGSWKSIGTSSTNGPISASYLASVNYVNGAVYWFYRWRTSCTIDSFDLESEKFESVPPPPMGLVDSSHVSIGVLGGCLGMFHNDGSQINVWEMNDSGAQRAWSNKFTIVCPGSMAYGAYIPMKYSKNGGLLVFHSCSSSFVYYHPENKSWSIVLKLRGFKSVFQAISHVPSFISLKDILVGKDMEVLNINSRCAGLKLAGEIRPLFLEEETTH